MKDVRYVVFRYLTNADFFNIYKPSGTEPGGGGQSYIDFRVGSVTASNWASFFAGVPSTMLSNGPRWTFTVHSIGLTSPKKLSIYQRRSQSFTVSSQKITSTEEKRIPAWHPNNGFPEPQDPTDRKSCPTKLAIYIVRTTDGQFWAGWFRDTAPCRDKGAEALLTEMLPGSPGEGHAGFIAPPNGMLLLDETDRATPFLSKMPSSEKPRGSSTNKGATTKPSKPAGKEKPEDEVVADLFGEDYSADPDKASKEAVVAVRVRNQKAVKGLKLLYKGMCQITGSEFTFLKRDGTPYCEAHHLIPLGEAGADSPYNIIIVNPLMHRMLHYANVSEIDLSQIAVNNSADLQINGKLYTIKWHPEHANYVKKQQEGGETKATATGS